MAVHPTPTRVSRQVPVRVDRRDSRGHRAESAVAPVAVEPGNHCSSGVNPSQGAAVRDVGREERG